MSNITKQRLRSNQVKPHKLLPIILLPLLAACGGGGGSDPDSTLPSLAPAPPTATTPEVTPETSDIVLFLQRASFGPTMAEIEQLRRSGFEDWIEQQMSVPTTRQLPLFRAAYEASGLAPGAANFQGQLRNLRMDVWWQTTLRGPDQLRQRVAFALSQLLVVSDIEGALRLAPHGIADYHDTLADHAFGNYRDLLEAVTLHPVMGDYLSMRRNEKADATKNIFPDENYAREILQLFSIGLKQLNPDGSWVIDSEGEAVLTYTQQDILNFARVFTGWNYADVPSFRSDQRTVNSYIQPMRAFESFHDSESKVLLGGVSLPAGQSAKQDLEAALDNIYNHDNVAPFISLHLIQRLVTSNPSPEYVRRVVEVFSDDGGGERGNLGAVVKAILLDPEALTVGVNSGKLKEPLLRLTQLWRAFDAEGVNGYVRFANSEVLFGQRAYGAFSVFNFFQRSYSQPGPIAEAGLLSPEFQILNESLITASTETLQGFAHSYNVGSNPAAPINQVILDTSAVRAMAANPSQLLDHLDVLLLADTMPLQMKRDLESYLAQIPMDEDGGAMRVNEALTMIITSPHYAVQR